MKEYVVRYTWQKNPRETYMFLCKANNAEDAANQCVKDHPDCEVVSVDTSDNFNKHLAKGTQRLDVMTLYNATGRRGLDERLIRKRN